MRIQLYVLREVFVAFCFAVCGMMVLALPALAVQAIHKLPGVDVRSVLLYLPLLVAGLLPYLLPLGFLLAVVSAYARLASDNEWTAIRMTGAHPARILLPGAALGVVLFGVTFLMLGSFLPKVRRQQNSYLAQSASQALQELAPGRTEIRLGDFHLNARRREGKAFVDAHVYLPAVQGEPARNLRADRIEFQFEDQGVLMFLTNARAVVGGTEIHNGNMNVRVDLAGLDSERDAQGPRKLRYRTNRQIRRELAQGAEPEREQQLRYELHYRMSLASVYGVFLLLAAPTGLLARRGNHLPSLALAAVYALAFYLLHMRLGKKLAEQGVLAPEPCAWAAIALGALAGIAFTWRVLRR